MKFRFGVIVLSLVMLFLFYKVYDLSTSLQEKNDELEETVKKLEQSEEDLEGEKAKLEKIQAEYEQLKQQQLEGQDDLWEYTVSTNTLDAYEAYVKIKGIEEHKQEIYDKLDEFLSSEGYVQFTESNGTKLFKEYTLGDRKDLFVPTSARSVRVGVIGVDEKYGRNGDVILEGHIVKKVGDYIESGTSKWAKIKYNN